NKIGSIISIVDLPTTNIIEPFIYYSYLNEDKKKVYSHHSQICILTISFKKQFLSSSLSSLTKRVIMNTAQATFNREAHTTFNRE
ncbi:hypothetical protein, partial [Streptococcus pneumoniae]|uniref:hypothetical protein n=2 Tax=Streptococcus pneumoniae TaxID=1313 RepID=UPI00099CF9EC